MKRFTALMVLLVALAVSVGAGAAESITVCNAVTLAASSTTDCKTVEVRGGTKFFSFQVYCTETTGDSMSIGVDWIAGSADTAAYMAIPLLSGGTAMSQLVTAYTTEAAWRALQSVQPPLAPYVTLRFTENNGDADVVCSAVLNVGD